MNKPAQPQTQADRPIFIGGLMKSGTSLLRILLGQHSAVFSCFESHWFEDAMRRHWDDPTSRRMELFLNFFEIERADYDVLCATKRAAPAREFIDIAMAFCTTRAGKSRWVEKTPGNIIHWQLIKQLWPDGRFIHVTREYKDCFASWKEWRGDSLDTFMAAVSESYANADGLLGTCSESYLEVDHDALVNDPQTTMRRVLEFAELDWEPACAVIDLAHTNYERAKVIDVLSRDSHTNVSLTKPIFTDSVGHYKSLLSTQEIDRIERELAPYYAIYQDRWGGSSARSRSG